MVESIKELKKYLARRKNPDLIWVNKYFSLYITKILLHTSISANQTSLLAIFSGVIASLIFIFGNVYYSMIAALLLYLWCLGDYCDGNIARYRKTAGGIGTFFDWLNEHSVPHIVFICISIGVYYQTGNIWAILFGISATVFWFMSYTYDHILEIIHLIMQADKSLLKRIKFSLPNYSKLAIKIIDNLRDFFDEIPGLKEKVKKNHNTYRKSLSKMDASGGKILPHLPLDSMSNILSSKPKRKDLFSHVVYFVYMIFGKILAHCYIAYYVMAAAFLDLILHAANLQFPIPNMNFMYIILIFFGIMYPVLWISKRIVDDMYS